MAFQASHDAIQSGTGAATASSSELKGLLTVDSMESFLYNLYVRPVEITPTMKKKSLTRRTSHIIPNQDASSHVVTHL